MITAASLPVPVPEGRNETVQIPQQRSPLRILTDAPGWVLYHVHSIPCRLGFALSIPAKLILSHAFPMPQKRVARLLRKARRLIAEGREQQAIQCFDRANSIDPTNTKAFAGRAGLRLLRREPRAAEYDFRRAIHFLESVPDGPVKRRESIECFSGLILALLRQRKFPEAMRVAARGDSVNGANHVLGVRNMLGLCESVQRDCNGSLAGC